MGSHRHQSSGGRSEPNGLDLVSGYKRLPKQDVLMRPLKSVLVKRRNSEGEGTGLDPKTEKKILRRWEHSGCPPTLPPPRILQSRGGTKVEPSLSEGVVRVEPHPL